MGAIQYLTFTRPDICFVVNRVCQIMHAPTDSYEGVVKHILRYLRGTAYISLAVPPLIYMALQMQIGQVVLIIANLWVVILSSLVRCRFHGNQASNAPLLSPPPRLSIRPWQMALLRLSSSSIY